MDKNISRFKYTILRRAVQYGKNDLIKGIHKNYSKKDLVELSEELEGKTFPMLSKIHKKWIGY